MSYSVFRVEGVKNTSSLKGLCKHNKDRISNTNPDIDKDKSKDNIVLVECDGTYNKKFNEITKEMRIQHDERMKTMRADRVKSFDRSLDDSSSDVACEMLFTSDEKFFENMNKDQIRQWAQESLNFVTKDIGIKKENIIHAVVHMDEKTPHLHVVAVPLIDTYDKRRKQNTLKISRAKYIQGGKHLTKLQDVYNERMNACGYKLDRGDIGNLKVHEKTADYKARQVKGHQRAEAGRTEDVAARNGNRYSFGIYRCDELYQYRAWQYIRQKAGNCNIRKHWHDRKTTAQAAFDRRDVLCRNFAFPDGNGGTWH